MRVLSRLRWLSFVCFAFVLAVGASAEEGGPGLGSQAELEAWLDGAVNAHLQAYHSAGATVSVVKDGALFFSKGYGYADVEARKKVDPAKTLFRIGSVSKIFVWTSVMQLVEEGRLDLQADVNTYLTDLKVPERYGGPVTMAHLMSHTPGFEDVVIGLFGRDEETLLPLGEILQREMPARVRNAGQMASYSNHGTGLAMYVVEEITGVPWRQYIEENILDPLGMSQITFEQPIPEHLAADMSKGYRYRGNVFEEEDFEFVPLGAIGCASASAEAMAKFMIAHLHLGRLGDSSILEEETAELMQSDLHRMAPGVNPMAHGFMVLSRNEQRVIGHGGATLWFHTQMALLPEHNVGVFVSHNTNAGSQGSASLVDQFLDQYYPEADAEIIEPPAGFDERAAKYAGTYHGNRHSYKTVAKLGAAFNAVTVSASGDGALQLSSTGKTRWIESAPLTFREEFGHDTIIFRENERGKITHMMLGSLPVMAFDKDGIFDSPRLHMGIFVVSIAFFVLTVVVWPAAAVLRWRYDVLLANHERFPVTARLIAWAASTIFLAFVVGVTQGMGDAQQIVFGVPQGLEILLYLPMAGAVLLLGSIAYAVYVWKSGQGRIVSRAYYSLLLVVSVAFLWLLFYWNLLGHRY